MAGCSACCDDLSGFLNARLDLTKRRGAGDLVELWAVRKGAQGPSCACDIVDDRFRGSLHAARVPVPLPQRRCLLARITVNYSQL